MPEIIHTLAPDGSVVPVEVSDATLAEVGRDGLADYCAEQAALLAPAVPARPSPTQSPTPTSPPDGQET